MRAIYNFEIPFIGLIKRLDSRKLLQRNSNNPIIAQLNDQLAIEKIDVGDFRRCCNGTLNLIAYISFP